ncbi:hypothetical protein IWW50_004688 [Coemansia erecta]|nr:hypothetical protein GGF43_005862 [Coemansia sp. RSA 2618]KAJ2821317.1 hypothetical protein IWW50_004688 [Coemansia erecta]
MAHVGAARRMPRLLHRAPVHTDSSSPLDRLSRGLTSVFQPAQHGPAPVDAQFTVVDAKHGSLVRARLPPHSHVVARVGQLVGVSVGTRVRAAPNGAFAVAALRPLLGRHAFVQRVATDEAAADVLIAPRSAGDVAVVGMAGAADYFVRRGCVLAQTAFLHASTWRGVGAAFGVLAFDRVGGRGAMVINGVGGLHRLVLRDGEEYLVDPRFVVAWSSTLAVCPQSGRPPPMQPAAPPKAGAFKSGPPPLPFVASSPAVSNTVAAPARSPSAPVQTARKSTMRDLSTLGSRVLDYTLFPVSRGVASILRAAAYASANAARTGAWAAAKAVRTLAGVPDLYRVTGPGEIYVSSRVQPRPWTRVTETIAAKSSQ